MFTTSGTPPTSPSSILSGTSRSADSDTTSLGSLHAWVFRQESGKSELKLLPSLPQKNFIHLWRTLHDMFMQQSENSAIVDLDVQQLYHSVSVVGTLLLQIGEVGQRVKKSMSMQSFADGVREKEKKNGSGDSNKKTEGDDDDWAITFEQFIASFLNESCLVEYFDRKIDVAEGIRKLENGKLLQKQESVQLKSKSVFYV